VGKEKGVRTKAKKISDLDLELSQQRLRQELKRLEERDLRKSRDNLEQELEAAREFGRTYVEDGQYEVPDCLEDKEE